MKRLKKRSISSVKRNKSEALGLAPQAVLKILKDGNKDFVGGNLTIRNNSKRVRDAALGQFPMAAVLSCLDSRLPVEDIFHMGIGDIFVTRVAGNVVNEDILGSLEYACKVSTAKVIVVLGHEHCGAVRSAVEKINLGFMANLLLKIKPAVQAASKSFKGGKNSKNAAFIKRVSTENVKNSLKTIRAKSAILKKMEKNGEIILIGGMYNMHSGKVNFFSA